MLGDHFKLSWVQYKRKATTGSKGVALEYRIQVELGFRSELVKKTCSLKLSVLVTFGAIYDKLLNSRSF